MIDVHRFGSKLLIILIMSFNSSSDSLSADFTLAHDPYERFLQQEKYQKNLVAYDNSSKFSKKFNKFKAKLHDARNNMIQGAIMGFLVGGLFGFAVGCYSAIQTRRFLAIPISTLVSGCSFGFILGCGSMIRSAELQTLAQQLESGELQLKEAEWLDVQQFNNRLSL